MVGRAELEITADLFSALTEVLSRRPTEAESVVIVAAYLYSLARDYGLSESQDLTESRLDGTEPPAQAVFLVSHFLAVGAESGDGGYLGDRLYSIFVDLSRDVLARKALNRNAPLSEMGLLKVAQVFWNIEGTDARPLLPIRSGEAITAPGRGKVRADIRVPGANKDFATMRLTERTKVGATGLGDGQAYASSGQGFRTKGARLAVLAAQRLLGAASHPPPAVDGAVLDVISSDRGKPRATLSWPDDESNRPMHTAPSPARAPTTAPPEASGAAQRSTPQVLVGGFAEVGSGYQRRGVDDEIDRVWAEGGDRRVWLRGGPGLGKSYSARRVMQDALARRGDDLEDLLIWVDSADPQSVRQAFSSAVDRMPQLGVSVAPQASDRVDRPARALLEVLARSTWRWLIVLDNADAGGLIEAELIPSGLNPNGRVLITTLSRDHRIPRNGRVVAAELFTPPEAEVFLRAQVDPTHGRPAALARSSLADTAALAAVVGYHPLALSIAAATIVANAMEIADWIAEFHTAGAMDTAADARDAGGYPHLIGATWRLALGKASLGQPDGVVERAAMVAAIQDPDGHPTWLWDREAVIKWVAGGSELVRQHGVPAAIQRLIDHGMIELRGDTWRGGELAIHQLAARAVRELASAEDLASLAAILVNEWLLHLTEDESGTRSALRRNIEPLMAPPALTSSTKQATTALLGYSLQGGTRAYERQRETKEGIAAYLAKGGVTGQAMMAHQLATLGDKAGELGLFDEARAKYTLAAQLYEQVIGSPSVDDDARAEHLHVLGKLHEKLGHADRAREAFTHALRLYEQLLDVSPDWVDGLISLAELHKALGNRDALVAVIERVAGAIDAMTDLGLVEAVRDAADQFEWEGLAEDLGRLGLLDRAARLQALIAEASQRLGSNAQLGALRKLARIRAEAHRWGEAEDALARVATGEGATPDDLVLLASIQAHLGRMDDAEKNTARAAKVYRSRERDRPEPYLNDPSRVRDAALSGSLLHAAAQAGRLKRWDDAASLYEGLVDYHGKHADGDPGEHEHMLALSNLGLGETRIRSGQPGEAVDPLTQAVSTYQMLTDLNPDDQKAQTWLVSSLTLLTRAHARLRRPEEAMDQLKRAMEIIYATPDPDTEDRPAQEAFAAQLEALGDVSTELGKLDEAAYGYLRLVGIRLMTAKQALRSAAAARNLARAEYRLGSVEQQLARLDSAESWLASAVYWRQELADLDPEDRGAQGELAEALAELGIVHIRLERVDEAERTLQRAVEIHRTLADVDPDDRVAQASLAAVLAMLGVLYRAVDRLEDAVDCQTRATNVFLLLIDLAPGHPEAAVVKGTILTLTSLADNLRSLGRFDEAETATARAEELAGRFPDPDPNEGD